MPTKSLSILIVNYNVAPFLRASLHSLQKYISDVQYEILVVDNNSQQTDWRALQKEFPDVVFFALTENVGFAKANNFLANKASGDYILLLNPDTEFLRDGFAEVFKFAISKENLGCLGVKMHDLQGNFHMESKRSIPDVVSSFYKLFLPNYSPKKSYYRNDIAPNDIAPVEVITGAFLLCQRQRYLQIGGLDEQYFMYGEDIDLCYQFLQKGYQNWYYGAFSILHLKGESTVKDEKYVQRFYGAMQIFVKKYYTGRPLLQAFIHLGLWVKKRLALRQIRSKVCDY